MVMSGLDCFAASYGGLIRVGGMGWASWYSGDGLVGRISVLLRFVSW